MTLSFSSRLGDFDTSALESYLADKEVIRIEHHFFEVGQKPFLTLLIHCETALKKGDVAANSKPEVDPKSLLSDEEWPLYETLRQWRNEVAKEEGIPNYTIFKNAVLVDLVKKRPSSLAQLQTISGIGQNKAGKYGESLLSLISPQTEKAPNEFQEQP